MSGPVIPRHATLPSPPSCHMQGMLTALMSLPAIKQNLAQLAYQLAVRKTNIGSSKDHAHGHVQVADHPQGPKSVSHAPKGDNLSGRGADKASSSAAVEEETVTSALGMELPQV